MAYLQVADYLNYGLPAGTSADWVTAASALINSFCRRPDLNVVEYTERMRMSSGVRGTRLSYLPLAPMGTSASPLVSVRGRYGRPRRGEMEYAHAGLAEAAAVFASPGQWTQIDPSTVDCDWVSGEVNLAGNLLGFNFNEIEVTYTAGLAAIGDDVKSACAQIVRNAQATPALNTSRTKIDTMQVEYFSSSLLDETVRAWLRPYVASRLG